MSHMEFLTRAQLVKLKVDRLGAEARTCTDPERITTIREEMEVLAESMREIRREQLMDQLPKPKSPWWKCWLAFPSFQAKSEEDA